MAWMLRWLPGLQTLLHYQRNWWARDAMAGLALSAVLVPVGMGYAQASGLPAIYGLYASIVPLLVYALVGPSRILVLGPDSTLAAVIAAVIAPMALGDAARAAELAALLAVLAGGFSLLIGLARLGLLADLLSKPIRIGFLNAIALTVLVGQTPKLLGLQLHTEGLARQTLEIVTQVLAGQGNMVALALGGGSLAAILVLRRSHPRWPVMLVCVVLATALSAALNLHQTVGLRVLGPLPQGLPSPGLPGVGWQDAVHLLPAALLIALLTFADTSVLSRALAVRGGYQVNPNQEVIALGLSNLATGLFQGFPVSASSSRTPVAEAAGARTQLCGVFGALTIAALLLWAPSLLRDLPIAVLGAVVMAACLSLADFRGMAALYRLRKAEFGYALASFLGVAFVGAIEGIAISVGLALLALVWNAWHPHYTTLVRVDGTKGYHDIHRHPEGRHVPGLVLFRWDEQLFFANAEVFHQQALLAAQNAPTPTRRLVVVADAITDVDVTAADALLHLHEELVRYGIELWFAGLKGPVKDRLRHYGTLETLGEHIFSATAGYAVNQYRQTYKVDWKDWDES
ncbi:SulP family inorganic anion transporter [Curvibacter sp. APW13]|uniref:SulP family inorganic anion transporter n=1 Tax=Curvibacter sp. APW13 TaxID=3077236 RepID=UPI0028DF37A8|nr:SulP family inorganic anion transporter [Curvibacter sp. APW13]MDT8992508.1 SulP family inorganic anion transporter [Curvibacter sp. APW13]